MKTQLSVRALALGIAMVATITTTANASTVRDDVDYQLVRDFAENKGQFAVGAVNLPIYDKNGTLLGTALPTGIPMPNLATANIKTGTLTLVTPQIATSAMHNTDYVFGVEPIQFGSHHGNRYEIVSRNNAERLTDDEIANLTGADFDKYNDFMLPRFDKLVTEVAPAYSLDEYPSDFSLDNYTAFVRIGGGVQNTASLDNVKTTVYDAYYYLTAGTPLTLTPNLSVSTNPDTGTNGYYLSTYPTTVAGLFDKNNSYSPLVSLAERGDSGSGLYGYHKDRGRWELIGVMNTGGTYHWLTPYQYNNYYTLFDKEFFDVVKNYYTGVQLNGTDEQYHWAMRGNNSTLTANSSHYNYQGDDIIINQNATITLDENINQGNGAIHIGKDTPSRVTITGDHEWQGAGIIVEQDSHLDWQVNNPTGDRLAKLGAGSMTVSGRGVNGGDISIGDGTVTLAKSRDDNGNQQAFNVAELVSGRGTLILADNQQIKPDNIRFGYGGGRLDLNGNAMTVPIFYNLDKGAMIVNGASHTANLTLIPTAPTSLFAGIFGETDSTKPNGKLNITYSPTDDSTLILTGGSQLNGTLTATNGTLLLTGSPTPHAYDYLNDTEPMFDDDWQTSDFTLTNLTANNNATLIAGRNIGTLTANINAHNNSTVRLGFDNGTTPVCVRTAFDLNITCTTPTYDDKVLSILPNTHIVGDLTLTDTAKFTLANATLTGKATASSDTQLHLTNSHWTMGDDSTLGNLTMDNSTIVLGKDNAPYHTLTINGNLAGRGQLHYRTDISNNIGDKVVLNGNNAGDFVLKVANTGTEPTADRLTLLTTNPNQSNTANITLANDFVDLGAYRYTLIKDGNDYRLHSPTLENALATSRYTNTALSLGAVNGLAVNRLNVKATDKRFWASVRHFDHRTQSNQHRPHTQTGTTTELGTARPLDNATGTATLGAMLTHSDSNAQFADDIKHSQRLNALTVFGKQRYADGSFVGVSGIIGQTKNDISDQSATAHPNQTLTMASVWAGKTLTTKFANITPSVGADYWHWSDSHYSLNGANIINHQHNAIQHRIGLDIDKHITLGNHIALRPFLASHYQSSPHKTHQVSVNGNRFTDKMTHQHTHTAGLEWSHHKGGVALTGSYTHNSHHNHEKSASLQAFLSW